MSDRNFKQVHIFTALVLLITLGACASNSQPTQAPEPEVYEPVVSSILYKVQPNDRLGDIAQEFTGNSANWRIIAEHNNITDPKRLKVGTVLEIPASILPQSKRSNTIKAVSANTNSKSNTTSLASNATLAVKQNNTAANSEVLITPVQTNRSFELNPIETETQTSVKRGSASSDNERYIKVVGTYYPKGIYAQPAAHSKLLLRVAPGTQFILDRQVNDWFKIVTDNGSGYIRMSDAKLL